MKLWFNLFRNTQQHLLLPLVLNLLVGLSIYPLAVSVADTLPELNDSASLILSAEDEIILGRKLMLAARARLNLLDDPILQDYVQTLTDHLAQFSSRSLPDLQVSIAQNTTINAFAAPGGQIAINTGLLSATRTEGELASVIAHEISHHSQRHIPRMLENSKKVSLPSAAALIGGLLIGGQAGAATIAAVRAAVISNQLEYSRGFEQEADASGMKVLARAGFDPLSMPAFFSRLERQTQGSKAPEFLRTHPWSTNRIADAKARVSSLGLLLEDEPIIDTLLDFTTAKARSKALYDEPLNKIIQQFEAGEAASGVQSNFANRYGLSLALIREDNLAKANKVLSQINPETNRQNDLLQLAQAELLIKQNVKRKALVILQSLYQRHPSNFGIGFLRASTSKRIGLLDEAYKQARKVQRTHPDNPEISLLLADIAGTQQDLANAALNKAQYFFEIGHYVKAAEVLQPYVKTGDSDTSPYIRSRSKDLLKQVTVAQTRSDALKL